MIVEIAETQQITDPSAFDSPYAEWNVGALPFMRNCYAFACNAKKPDGSRLAQGRYEVSISDPGERTGNPYNLFGMSGGAEPLRTTVLVESLRAALVSDGFAAVPYDNQKDISSIEGNYLVAAYVNSYLGDFHFYRRHEKSGVWYHKPGWFFPVTDRDELNKKIIDPQEAEHEYCNKFAGYFFAPNSGIKLNIQVRPFRPPHTRWPKRQRKQKHWLPFAELADLSKR